jgi:hypothetical protein
LSQLKPFPTDPVFERSKSGGVATGPCHAVDKACADRIRNLHEHNRHGAAHFLQCAHCLAAIGQNNVGERDQLGGVFANVIGFACARAEIDPHVVPFGPTQLPQGLHKFRIAGPHLRIVRGEGGGDYADTPHPLGLLRTRRERPRERRAAEKRDEVAPFQLIELHFDPGQPGPNCSIPDWRGSVRRPQASRVALILPHSAIAPRCQKYAVDPSPTLEVNSLISRDFDRKGRRAGSSLASSSASEGSAARYKRTAYFAFS